MFKDKTKKEKPQTPKSPRLDREAVRSTVRAVAREFTFHLNSAVDVPARTIR
jgi:hypothetical protein